jgi:DNA-binding GntR family transcriptional regulator
MTENWADKVMDEARSFVKTLRGQMGERWMHQHDLGGSFDQVSAKLAKVLNTQVVQTQHDVFEAVKAGNIDAAQKALEAHEQMTGFQQEWHEVNPALNFGIYQ